MENWKLGAQEMGQVASRDSGPTDPIRLEELLSDVTPILALWRDEEMLEIGHTFLPAKTRS